MKILHIAEALKKLCDRTHPDEHTYGYTVKGIDEDIEFLKTLLNANLDRFNAIEQNKLINLIQKLVLVRDMVKKQYNE